MGWAVATSTTVGVTRIVPSVSVPLRRESERRSQPSWPCMPPEYTMSSNPVSSIARAAPLSSSALNGSMPATRMPMMFVRWLRRLRATRLVSKSSSSIASRTRVIVPLATP